MPGYGNADAPSPAGAGAQAPSAGESFLRIEEVSYRYGATEAVRDVTFSVERGTIFGLVGSDGAGKSTLLRAASTMIKPERAGS
jgi:ABC-2 type transport system ATP-binding protein